MEQYILVGLCFSAWAATVGLVMWLMRGSDTAFIIGSLLGVLSAGAAGGAYYQYLDACQICP